MYFLPMVVTHWQIGDLLFHFSMLRQASLFILNLLLQRLTNLTILIGTQSLFMEELTPLKCLNKLQGP